MIPLKKSLVIWWRQLFQMTVYLLICASLDLCSRKAWVGSLNAWWSALLEDKLSQHTLSAHRFQFLSVMSFEATRGGIDNEMKGRWFDSIALPDFTDNRCLALSCQTSLYTQDMSTACTVISVNIFWCCSTCPPHHYRRCNNNMRKNNMKKKKSNQIRKREGFLTLLLISSVFLEQSCSLCFSGFSPFFLEARKSRILGVQSSLFFLSKCLLVPLEESARIRSAWSLTLLQMTFSQQSFLHWFFACSSQTIKTGTRRL